ncbi:MAG: oligosaccharide flippase family protein, partial [Woeseiaceae bacterium]|nr:oligosaccharide flippase family protein [Woeseiaceae bacterium]
MSDAEPQTPPVAAISSFRNDVMRLVTGTGIAQLIGILAAPILAKLFAPEAFGIATLFASLTLIFGVVACLRYELSIVLPDEDSEAANLLGVSLLASVAMSALLALLVGIAGPQLAGWAGIPELAPYLWLLPLAILLHGTFSAFNYWNTRTKNFSRLAATRVTNQVVVTSTNLSAGFAGFATGGVMIAAGLAGRGTAILVLATGILRDSGRL